MVCLITRVALIDKVYNHSYETHDKIASLLADIHDDIAYNTKEDANLGDQVAMIGWHFKVVI